MTAVPLIAVTGLDYRYHGRPKVLDGAEFTLYQGEKLALLGDNGAGKTTLLQIILGLKKAKQGRIVCFGQQCESESDFVQLRRRIGLLFQDPDDQLFCPTVLEDVCFGPLNLGCSKDVAIQRSQKILECLGMSGFEQRVTHQLSGGEKRMITLASVLVMEPDVLLLDEPTNALDRHAKKRLLDILLHLPQAMLIISHDNEFVDALATRKAMLQDGVITELAML